MKICDQCGQLVAEDIISCPACGSDVIEGRKYVDDYHITKVLHEGYSSILCKAIQDETEQPVMIRIFTPQSGVDDAIAQRLLDELEKLKELPEDYFVRHLEIKKSGDGLWYRVTEWYEAEKWGTLLASGRLNDPKTTINVFYQIATILEGLHQYGHIIPHLIMDDIIVFTTDSETLGVKIDFKLSRFLDPTLDKPGPMLRRLLAVHPDIINNRPLDVRSDIWSLGKFFVEILTADYDAPDFKVLINDLNLPNEIKALFKVMLADDPDLRPKSMADVAQVLAMFKDLKKIEPEDSKQGASKREIKGIKTWMSMLVILAIILVLGGLAWLYFALQKGDSELVFENFVERYAASVAFVVTEYRLEADENVVYQNWTEGTAFLVDKMGYLMTNRHVACPWLEDTSVNALIAQYELMSEPIDLVYRIFLWFEGERAFKRLPILSDSSNLEEVYFLESAYRTDGTPRLTIAGVARVPEKTWQVIQYPLQDDFAVLKIDKTPKQLLPLPLELNLDTSRIRRLSPVITIGFPLGSETQETTVNVSVTRGHVRRTFRNLFQVDTSIYRGNSGGPIIDRNGKVLGIASKVAVEMASAPLPVATRLSDIGMVLPINKAAVFLQEIKAGQEKWNGVLDPSIDRTLVEIKQLALERKWEDAESKITEALDASRDPILIAAAGMVAFCLEKYTEAGIYFKRAVSMDTENHFLRFMIFLTGWQNDRPQESLYADTLLSLDWRSPWEFFAYLTNLLKTSPSPEATPENMYSRTEKSWFNYIRALSAEKSDDWINSEMYYRAALLAADSDSWVYTLAFSGLDRVKQIRLEKFTTSQEKSKYMEDNQAFQEMMVTNESEQKKRNQEIVALIVKLKQQSTELAERIEMLQNWYALDSENKEILVWLSFYYAMEEKWDLALSHAKIYLQTGGRENAGRLSLGILEAGIHHFLGSEQKANASLQSLESNIKDPWYQKIIRSLQGKLTDQVITMNSGDSPEYLLYAHVALGFWAEGSGDRTKASEHYEESLGSYLDENVEYEFAMSRLKSLKTNSP
jgi:S1-C subfamily serine protease